MTTLQSLQKAKEGIASEKRKTVAPTLLARAYAQRAGDREPLHLRMRLAILDALAQGAWSAGDKLPAERDIDLTDILDQRDRDYCIAVLRSRCVGGADVWGAGGR